MNAHVTGPGADVVWKIILVQVKRSLRMRQCPSPSVEATSRVIITAAAAK